MGLVNIGVEEEKGNKLAKEAFQMMKAQNSYRFIGNCEAREVPSGANRVSPGPISPETLKNSRGKNSGKTFTHT